jgi:hypothetical protein
MFGNHPLRANVAGIPTSQNPDTPEGLDTRPNQSSENSIEPEWILAELPCSSYSEDSRQAGKSSSPQNLTSLATL